MDTMYRGTITRVAADGVYVEVPRLGLGVEFGPCDVITPPVALSSVDNQPYTQPDSDVGAGAGAVGWRTHGHSDAGSSTLTAHRHGVFLGKPGLRPGLKVLLSTVGGVKEDLVLLGVIA